MHLCARPPWPARCAKRRRGRMPTTTPTPAAAAAASASIGRFRRPPPSARTSGIRAAPLPPPLHPASSPTRRAPAPPAPTPGLTAGARRRSPALRGRGSPHRRGGAPAEEEVVEEVVVAEEEAEAAAPRTRRLVTPMPPHCGDPRRRAARRADRCATRRAWGGGCGAPGAGSTPTSDETGGHYATPDAGSLLGRIGRRSSLPVAGGAAAADGQERGIQLLSSPPSAAAERCSGSAAGPRTQKARQRQSMLVHPPHATPQGDGVSGDAAAAAAPLPSNLLSDDRLTPAPPRAPAAAELDEEAWREAMRRERHERGLDSAASSSAAPPEASPDELWRLAIQRERNTRLDSDEWRHTQSMTPAAIAQRDSEASSHAARAASRFLSPPPFLLASTPLQATTPPTPPQPPSAWLEAGSRAEASSATRGDAWRGGAGSSGGDADGDLGAGAGPGEGATPEPPPLTCENSEGSGSERTNSFPSKRRGKAGNISGKATMARRGSGSGRGGAPGSSGPKPPDREPQPTTEI